MSENAGDVDHSDRGYRPAAEIGTATPARAGRALVVEDEPDVAELIRYHLSQEGFDVAIARNGADALGQARETRPALAVLDIMIPQLNGWEMCRCVKRESDIGDVSVSWSRAVPTRATRCWGSRWAPTTTSPSRSRPAS